MARNIEAISFLNMSDVTRQDVHVVEKNLHLVNPDLQQDLKRDYQNGEVSYENLTSATFIEQEKKADEVAYHEAAHYVVGSGDSATIIPSSEGDGLTVLPQRPIQSFRDIEELMVTCYAGGAGSEMRGRGSRGCGSDRGKARWLARLHSRFSKKDPEALQQSAEMSARCEVQSKRYQIGCVANRLRRRGTVRR